MRKIFRFYHVYDFKVLINSFIKALSKLSVVNVIKNPVMFIVWIVAIITLINPPYEAIYGGGIDGKQIWFSLSISIGIWFILIFSYFAESIAEYNGQELIDNLRQERSHVRARRLSAGKHEMISSYKLQKGDLVIVSSGELIPCDGEVFEGIAIVDESTLTGESAPVIKENIVGKNLVTFGTKVISDSLIIRVTNTPTDDYMNKMQTFIKSAKRNLSPNEQAISYILTGFSLLYVIMCIAIIPLARYLQLEISFAEIAALLICVMPTTAAALINPVAISAIERLLQRNIFVLNGKAVESAGDIDAVLMDKTGTITIGYRVVMDVIPIGDVQIKDLLSALEICSSKDNTQEGKAITAFIKSKYGLKHGKLSPRKFKFIPFSAKTRISGVKFDETVILKGAVDAITKLVMENNKLIPDEFFKKVKEVGDEGATPLALIKDYEIMGIIKLNDRLRVGIKPRIERLQMMGIKVIMLSGDNCYTSKSIAKEVGIEDCICEADPNKKLKVVKELQEQGNIVAVAGEGLNDALAMSQADVGLTLGNAPDILKAAANVIERDNDPMKIIDLIEVGRELLITRGCITTFSLFNDITKFFVVVPAIFIYFYPELSNFNFLHLHSSQSSILSAVIFNTLIIILMLPLAIKGVKYRPIKPSKIAKNFFSIYGILGIIAPFIGIKIIDMLVSKLFI